MTASENHPPTPSDRFTRLRELLISSPTSRKLQKIQQRIQNNRPCNAMLAVLLHACARLEQGEPLSDLEEKTLNCVREHCSNDDLQEMGRIYQEITPEKREALFPGRLATLSVSQSYSEADFGEDLKTIVPELLSQQNIRIIDINQLAPDRSIPNDETYQEAARKYGYSLTYFTSSSPEMKQDNEPIFATITLDYHKCTNQSSEWSSSDEPFFVIGGGSDLEERTSYRSHIFSKVKADGSKNYFNPDAIAFKGWFSKNICLDIEIYEKDLGTGWDTVAEVLDKISMRAMDAAVALSNDDETRKGAAIAALVAIVSKLLSLIFGSFDDDFVSQHTFFWDKAFLLSHNASFETRQGPILTLNSENDGGDYDIYFLVEAPTRENFFNIINKNGKALDAAENERKVKHWTLNKNSNNQKWQKVDAGNDYFYLSNKYNRHVLDATSKTHEVLHWDSSQSDNQQWKLVDAGDGYYYIQNRRYNSVLDARQENSLVEVYGKGNWDSQKWRFDPADPIPPKP